MSTGSLPFLGSFLLLASVLSLLRGRALRQVAFMLANAGFIASFHPLPSTLVTTAMFLLGTWVFLALAARNPSGQIVFAGVGGAVIFLFVAKLDGGPERLLNFRSRVDWSNTVGLSYMAFKFIQVLVDVHQGQVRRLSFLSYLNYQLAFFTLTAGPINGYDDFVIGWDREEGASLEAAESFRLWSRIFSGVLKMAIVAPFVGTVLANGSDWVRPGLIPSAYLKPLLQFYLFPVQVFFDFSGYTDIAIGCAQLLGFKLPENFDRPFAARTIIDFWARWHMSLTRWLQVYFFTAAYRYVAEEGHDRRHLRAVGYVLMGTTMVLIGLWHGLNAGFLRFGIVSAVGIVTAKVWGDVLGARLGRAGFQRYLGNRTLWALSVLATFHFFCFSELFFADGMGRLPAFGPGILAELSRGSAGALVGGLLRAVLVPVVVSALVLRYAARTPGGAPAAGAPARRVREAGTVSDAPVPVVAGRAARLAPSFVPMALRGGLVALVFVVQAVQAPSQLVFYRWF